EGSAQIVRECVRKSFEIFNRIAQGYRALLNSLLELIPGFAQFFHRLSQGFLGLFAPGDVSQRAGKKWHAIEPESRDRQLDRNLGAIAAHGPQFDSFAKYRPLTGGQIMRQSTP